MYQVIERGCLAAGHNLAGQHWQSEEAGCSAAVPEVLNAMLPIGAKYTAKQFSVYFPTPLKARIAIDLRFICMSEKFVLQTAEIIARMNSF